MKQRIIAEGNINKATGLKKKKKTIYFVGVRNSMRRLIE